jgi:hypothetical protein
MGRIITLTSDFGLADEYVGVMKGVILSREPTAVIVDLTHRIEAHDVRQAAFLLNGAWSFFPGGTIHVAVVDPGVGSSRRVVLLETGGHYFLAPDNGLLSLVKAGSEQSRVWLVNRPSLFRERVSTTFHGRDIFAPVAASLASGLDPDQVGPRLEVGELLTLTDLEPRIGPGSGQIYGKVVQVDRFGNLITNIGRAQLRAVFSGVSPDRLRFVCGEATIAGLSETYASQPVGALLALIGSRDTLEIAVNQGRAAERLQAGVGEEIRVEKESFDKG